MTTSRIFTVAAVVLALLALFAETNAGRYTFASFAFLNVLGALDSYRAEKREASRRSDAARHIDRLERSGLRVVRETVRTTDVDSRDVRR